MVKNICKDPLFLSLKSVDANIGDINVAMDLLETLKANKDKCVGMAANMIGINKRIIVFYDQLLQTYTLMFNPKIIKKDDKYETQEACLSLSGVRKTIRYKKICVEYQDMSFKKLRKEYIGFTAQIIQHEVDMTNGILI